MLHFHPLFAQLVSFLLDCILESSPWLSMQLDPEFPDTIFFQCGTELCFVFYFVLYEGIHLVLHESMSCIFYRQQPPIQHPLPTWVPHIHIYIISIHLSCREVHSDCKSPKEASDTLRGTSGMLRLLDCLFMV
ncbi:hypothetical protein F4820DRAFT_315730 [Hypoxylon rubiginosum]|uniref:Uncharacterized protein n=1 Tax=Hypoxylon rubiginosum TaxID=110542 RepID=A0ACB9Z140_9PEZI|nr:hypothetical protein F4820DRAFT_315730 [Hypoxylon rubiginosum]